MTEKIFLIENADPVIFYGLNNSNIATLKNLFPKIKIIARGDVVKCIGEEKEIDQFGVVFKEIEAHCAKFNLLDEATLIDYVKGKTEYSVFEPTGQQPRPCLRGLRRGTGMSPVQRQAHLPQRQQADDVPLLRFFPSGAPAVPRL